MSTPNQPTGPYVFVSYASADHERVAPLVVALQGAGVPVWLDRQAIEGGENYGLAIAEGIERCAALVLACTAASRGSRNVRQEVALAWKYERPYVPLLLEPVAIPKEIEYWLEASQWVEVLDKPPAEWLPAVLAALAPHGFTPAPPEQLAGRERELTALRDHLAAARAGTGRLVLIGGEAGVGKTTLAEALCREAARRGGLVLTGRAFDRAETPAYGPWLYLFERYRPDAALPPPAAAFAEPGVVGAVASQDALFRQVRDFLAALAAQRPAVLLLDDLHWADPASLDLLRFLAHSLAVLPLLVLVTYRSDELTRRHPLYALLPQLVREAAAARLDLGRLDDAAVRALVAERYALPDADAARLVAYLQARAEGNALFVGELLRSLEEAGALRDDGAAWALGELTQAAVPPLLRQVIDGRLARLGEEAQRLLAVAAIIGHEIPLDVWATVGGVEEDALLDVVEAGVAARVLMESSDGTRVQFAHALIREALYEGTLATRRRPLHRVAGEALAATIDPEPDAVAYHFQQAGDARAVSWLERAGMLARRVFALQTARDRFDAALALLERGAGDPRAHGGILLRLAGVAYLTDLPLALRYLDEAARLAEKTDDRVLQSVVLAAEGNMQCLHGPASRGVAMMERSIILLEDLTPAEMGDLRARFPMSVGRYGSLAEWLGLTGHFARTLAIGEPFVAAAPPGIFSTVYGNAYKGLAVAYAHLGRPVAARAAFALAQQHNREAQAHVETGVTALYELETVLLLYAADRPEEWRRCAADSSAAWQRAMALAPDVDLLPLAELPIRFLEGEWETAARLAALWRARPRRKDMVSVVPGYLLRARGDGMDAQAYVRERLPAGRDTTMGDTLIFETLPLLLLAAALALDDGDPPQARAWLETHNDWLAWSGAVLGRADGALGWAAYHRAAGDLLATRQQAERALAHATEPRQPLALLAAHRVLGELDTEAGTAAAAQAHLDASLALAEACAAPYERALTLLARAELRAATGDRPAAQADLAEVKAICTPLEARPALARAEALAARVRSPQP